MTLNLNKAEFVRSAVKAKDFPRDMMPRVVFVGRSDVGKSSTINQVVGKKGFARVSSVPGKTVFVNLFKVDEKGWLIDLPGYGYARRGHEERKSWAELIQSYLEKTPTLRALALLIDCRIPTQESDRVMADFAKAHKLPVIPVLTKADKCTLKERSAQMKTWERILGVKPVAVSSVSKLGIDELWARLREAGRIEAVEEEMVASVENTAENCEAPASAE